MTSDRAVRIVNRWAAVFVLYWCILALLSLASG
jgi:hypothetical protein